MTNEMMTNMNWKPSPRRMDTTMDECYGFVQARLAEERAHAAQARLAQLAQRTGRTAERDGWTVRLAGLRGRIGHALVAVGSAVEGRNASHPHVPAPRAH